MALRTAEEILDTIEGNSIWGDLEKHRGDVYYAEDVIKLINEARKEAIEAAADLCDETEDGRFEHKSHILNLLTQIK